MYLSDNRCATKCYVLFVELVARDGTDASLYEHFKSKVRAVSKLTQVTQQFVAACRSG